MLKFCNFFSTKGINFIFKVPTGAKALQMPPMVLEGSAISKYHHHRAQWLLEAFF
jgi:hypothetical protein